MSITVTGRCRHRRFLLVLPGSLLLHTGLDGFPGPEPGCVRLLLGRVVGLVAAAVHGVRFGPAEPFPAEHRGPNFVLFLFFKNVTLAAPVHLAVHHVELRVALSLRVAALHLENHLHVVGPTAAPDLAGNVARSGGGDEVVVLASLELQSRRRWRECPESQCEESLVH